jgi:choline dehydrogenase-like flavoprotein
MTDTGFICGYTIEVVGPHPCDFASRLTSARGLWGTELRQSMLAYNYWSGLGIVGEVLAQESNCVSLDTEEKDCHGLPVARVNFGYHDNDRKLIEHAKGQMARILEAAGGQDAWTADRTAHLLGGCRMGANPTDSVVNGDCRSHDVSNLFICDGSVFTSSTAVNPSLTIQAIAARTADRMLELGVRREL